MLVVLDLDVCCAFRLLLLVVGWFGAVVGCTTHVSINPFLHGKPSDTFRARVSQQLGCRSAQTKVDIKKQKGSRTDTLSTGRQ